ncbi:cytochrome c [Paraflavitalea speifideaquila]|uniref:c-type cytochrome n=1 Tax=Paraflavitalea speifideaquila TaxID=3076558 RepID=UPI0028EC804C|nr:cytochrome c [Paraflavitalea speifideiaquila]
MFSKKTVIAGSLLTAMIGLAWAPLQDKKLEESKARGKELYQELCITCHLADGKGLAGAIPPLAGSDYLKNTAKVIYAIKFGLSDPIEVNGVKYSTPMPSPNISDEEVADVSTYILNNWGNKGKLITLKEVEKVKK